MKVEVKSRSVDVIKALVVDCRNPTSDTQDGKFDEAGWCEDFGIVRLADESVKERHGGRSFEAGVFVKREEICGDRDLINFID